MEFLISFLNTLLPMLYMLTTFLYGLYFFKEEEFAHRNMSLLLKITAALHLLEVVLRGLYYHHFPLASIAEALSVIALAAVLIYILLEIRLKIKSTGFFILIFVLLMQLISSAFINFTREIPEILQSPFFAVHTSAAILGYSAFTISFLYGFMYLLLFHDIKRSRFGVVYNRLPALEELSRLSYISAAIGLGFLTFAIIMGFIWSHKLFHKWVVADSKILVAYLTWIVYGLELVAGKFWNWSRKRLAYLSISGFVIILFSMAVVNLFFTSFHEFK